MITYVTGDATDVAHVPGKKIIAHVCNDIGRWGKGFVLSVSRRWPEPEKAYRQWCAAGTDDEWPVFELGVTLFVPVTPDTLVANMIAQRGIGPSPTPRISYDALEGCLSDVEMCARNNQHASVHMPRIGCGLGGGDWNEVQRIIDRSLPDTDVYVYDM